MPESTQTESEEEFLCANASVPLHRNVSKGVPFSAGQMDQEAHEMDLSNSHNMDLGLSEVTSSIDHEEGDLLTAVIEKEEVSSSHVGHEERDDNDEDLSLDGTEDLKIGEVTHSAKDEEEVQEEGKVLSPLGQEEPRSETEAQEPRIETEAHADDVQIGILEEDMASCPVLPASIVVSQVSEPTDEATNEAAFAEETLHVGIPEIIVSSPVPTDDEGSDAGSTFESDTTNDVQQGGEDNRTERQDVADNQSDSDSSGKSPSSNQEKKSEKYESDTCNDETKQKSGFSKNLPESNLLPFRNTTVYSANEVSSEQPGKEAIADETSPTMSQENVPNLGERASSLLSQLRSEIASMKTARLSSVSPVMPSDSEGNATDMSPLCDSSQPASQERDTTEPTVKYRLPLFEDLDSACTSFSLDDFLSDPAIEENADSALETDNKYEEPES